MCNPLLTIIMPTYNSSKYIDKTIDSLIHMIGKHEKQIEVLFIDDGSSDDTLEKLKKYVNSNHYMKIIKNKHAGVCVARNTGINIAKGEYITFLDSDDTFEKDFMDFFNSLLEAYEKPEIILADVRGVNDNRLLTNPSSNEKLQIVQAMFWLGNLRIEPGIAAKFFKRSFILKNKLLYDKRLTISEDELFNTQSFLKAKSILLTPQSFYHIKQSHTLIYFNKKILSGQLAFLDELKKLLQQYDSDPSALLILNRAKLTAIDMIVDRYYGPLYINGTNNLEKSASLLKQVIIQNELEISLNTKKFDSIISFRYRLFRKLLKYHQYKLCLLFDKYMDLIKGYNRFKKTSEKG